MRILLVSTYSSNVPSTIWCLTVGTSLAKMGHEVTAVILERDTNLSAKFMGSGIRLINRPLSSHIYDGFFFSPLVIPEIMFSNYDIVHVHHAANWGCILGAMRSRLRGTPLIITPHTSLFELPKIVYSIYKRLVKFVFGSASAILLLSDFHRDVLIDQQLWVNEKTTFLVHNPVSQAFFTVPRAPAPASCGIYVGRMESYQKALDRLVPVFGALRDCGIRFLMVGEGPFKETLDQLIQREKWTHVEMLGEIPNEALPQLLSSADFFIMPSRYETQPIALLEAMASGLPVVATDIPGITQFCPRDAGFFIKQPDHSDEWVKAISSLAQDPEAAYMMGMRARQEVKTHHPDLVATEHLDIYKHFVKEKHINCHKDGFNDD